MLKEKIDRLNPLEKKILEHMAIRCRSTTSGLGLSCFDDVFSDEHPEKVRNSISELVEKGYLMSPEKTVGRTSSVSFTDDGFHECRLAFKKNIDSQKEKADLVSEYIKRLRSNPVVAIVIVIGIALPWIMGLWKLLEIILKAW